MPKVRPQVPGLVGMCGSAFRALSGQDAQGCWEGGAWLFLHCQLSQGLRTSAVSVDIPISAQQEGPWSQCETMKTGLGGPGAGVTQDSHFTSESFRVLHRMVEITLPGPHVPSTCHCIESSQQPRETDVVSNPLCR